MADEDVAALHHPLKDDSHLLQGIIHNGLFPYETPFHVALAEGCVDRATEMLRENPALAHEPNRSGSYPLHVASARDYQGIVVQLLKISPSLCLLHDKEGRTPLHLAALNRKTDMLELLHPVHTKQKNIRKSLDGDDTAGGEQILHFCIKNNLLDVAEFLVKKDEKLMKTKDVNGNTVFHLLALATEDTQMLDFLLGKKDVKDVLNVKNKYGYTAFDISQRNSPPNTIISDKIQNAGGRGSFSLNWNIWYPKDQAWTNEMNNTLMVVATLIVAVTFQAAINPPGGVWQDLPDTNSASPAPSPKHSIDPSRVVLGTAIHNNINLTLFKIFMYFDTIAFSAALSIILSLLSGFSLRRRFTTWVMVISMWATLFSMGMAFAFGTLTVVHRDALKKIPYVLYSWLGTIVLVLLYHCVIFVVCLEDKIKKCWVNIMIMLGIKKDMTSDQEKKETSDDHKFHHKEMMA